MKHHSDLSDYHIPSKGKIYAASEIVSILTENVLFYSLKLVLVTSR